ncbi:MAG: hypothetical protein I3273_01550 [Candidatus Moeniiplasma glomeromycotorum]|nr:hypothetical protein [Candidatus Moeniiplasma glomeromycotorum]MCE8167193.1 hypothetical protein [Candidatus Moeniiplasma glomeromycotorum]MCE8168795.1 hypothetical protein [Candidatus Moeniiplasma glomeromycotorum]
MERKLNCCYLNNTLPKIYSEKIQGKRYYCLGYFTTYYYLLKDLKKQELLCAKCLDFSEKLFEIYLGVGWEV